MNVLALKPDRCMLKGGKNQLLIIISITLREIATETGSKKCWIGRKQAERRNVICVLIHAIASQLHCGGSSVINCIHHVLLIASPVFCWLIHLSHDHFQCFKTQISFPGPCREAILAVTAKPAPKNSMFFQLRCQELWAQHYFEL